VWGDFADLPVISLRLKSSGEAMAKTASFEIDVLLNRKGTFEFEGICAPTGWYCLHLYHHLNPFNSNRRLSW